MADVSFDGRSAHFQARIYGSAKGRLRLDLLLDSLAPVLAEPPLEVWDAGGGLGQMSLHLAQAGHRVLLSDPSGDMLAGAREHLAGAGASGVTLRQGRLQEMAPALAGRFDLVMCHAVLEWLEAPLPALADLAACVRPGGHLSLMAYSAQALRMMRLRRGQWQRLDGAALAGSPGGRGLTPPNPQFPADIERCLHGLGLEALERCAIRCIHDLLPTSTRRDMPYEALLALERRFCRDPEFMPLGRYQHWLVRKTP